MYILHVIPDLAPSTGGPVTAVLGMARAQAALGHNVVIAATDIGRFNVPRTDGVEVKTFPCTFTTWRWSRAFAHELPGLISNSDIVHIHTMWEYPTYSAAKVCNKLRKPFILRPCGMLDKWSLSQSAWKKKIYLRFLGIPFIRNAAALHFTTHEEVKNSLCFHREYHSLVIPIGLSPNAFEAPRDVLAFRRKFPELMGKRIILFFSRLHYKKQPNVVVEAFKEIYGTDERLVLVLAGPGEPAYLDSLRRLVRELNLEDRVIFTGLLQGETVREALHSAEVFVLPSLQENFGIAVAEAMAAGCPVVVSEQVNLAGEIRNGNAGIVCVPDVASIAAALKQVIGDDKFRSEMGKNGRDIVVAKFMWQKVAADLMTIYQDVLSSTRASTAWSYKGFMK